MIRRSAPRAFDQFDCAEFLNRNTAPVGRRTDWLEATLALSAVLIGQNSQLPVLVPPQSVGTKQPRERIVHRGYRPSVFDRCPDEAIPALLDVQFAARRAQTIDRQQRRHLRPGHVGGFAIDGSLEEAIQFETLP